MSLKPLFTTVTTDVTNIIAEVTTIVIVCIAAIGTLTAMTVFIGTTIVDIANYDDYNYY
jgi:hypothetical protein